VVKTREVIAQPASKVRGRQVVRMTYEPDDLAPENLSRLKRRAVGAKREPASQSEPIDPRL
jgi:protein phosphatase